MGRGVFFPRWYLLVMLPFSKIVKNLSCGHIGIITLVQRLVRSSAGDKHIDILLLLYEDTFFITAKKLFFSYCWATNIYSCFDIKVFNNLLSVELFIFMNDHMKLINQNDLGKLIYLCNRCLNKYMFIMFMFSSSFYDHYQI